MLLNTIVIMNQKNKMGSIKITSKSLKNNRQISRMHICTNQGGNNLNPDLAWTNIPGAKSYVLLVFDPDAPSGTWIHWLLPNIPPKIKKIPSLPASDNKSLEVYGVKIKQGKNSWGKYGYIGPCPPPGNPHKYYFVVYALDKVIDDPGNNTEEFLQKVKGHVIGKGNLMGTFRRN